MKKRKNPLTLFLFIWIVLAVCSPKNSEPPYENTCLPEMDYENRYVFNCHNDTKYPLETDRSLKRVEGVVDLLGKSKTRPNYCIVINDVSLWMEDTDQCLDIYELPFDLAERPSISVIGYYTGEKEEYLHFYDQFIIVDIREHDYICCNVCCNPESKYYNDEKMCFWYQPGKEKPFPYESIEPFSFLANAVLRFGGG
jgi:hypothetical protein